MKNTKPSIKTAIYCRLSEEDRNKQFPEQDSLSIQNQKSMLLQYAQDHQWEVYDIYSDDDYTGSDRKRPEFNRLLKDAENRKFNIILCKTQSRFTRELELVEKYIHGFFPLWGIRFVSVVDNADTADKANKKSRQINGLVNEWYLEDMSENIKSVLNNRRKNGFHIGSFALYGYRKDPNLRGHLLIDHEAAAVVREVFFLFSQGYGKTAIARILNERGIPNPTEYKRLHGLRYQQPQKGCSTLWSYSSIADMLTNEIYTGNMVQGKYGSSSYKTKTNHPRPRNQWYIVEGTHEAIIDRELWKQVQDLIKQKSRPFVSGKIGIFAQKTHCMYCGYTMRSVKHKSGRRYLKCPSHSRSTDACIGSFVSTEKLENAVLKELIILSEKYLNRTAIEKGINLQDDAALRISSLEQKISICQKKIKEYIAGLRELYLAKGKGNLSEEDFLDFSKDFSDKKELMEKQIMQITEQISCLKAAINSDDIQSRRIEQYLHPFELNRVLVDTMIDSIRIGKKDSDTNDIPVEIHWNF